VSVATVPVAVLAEVVLFLSVILVIDQQGEEADQQFEKLAVATTSWVVAVPVVVLRDRQRVVKLLRLRFHHQDTVVMVIHHSLQIVSKW